MVGVGCILLECLVYIDIDVGVVNYRCCSGVLLWRKWG